MHKSLTLALTCLILTSGCDEAPPISREAPPSRVEAVTVRREDPALRFCDVSAPVGQGRPFSLPALSGPPAPTTGWRWVNVWATWCAPCVEELPLIASFQARLHEAGQEVTPYFISVDSSDELVASYASAHEGTPSTARLTDPGGLAGLLSAFGLDGGATIPIHVLVDPTDHIRCVRSGSIQERDFETLAAIAR